MTSPNGYVLEMLVDDYVEVVEPQMEGQPIEVLIPPGSKILEVFQQSTIPYEKFGGTIPTDPAILVWYDTQGAR